MQFVRIDLSQPENNCEFFRHDLSHIPSMLYITSAGLVIETTDAFLDEMTMRSKLDNLVEKSNQGQAASVPVKGIGGPLG